MIPGMDVKPRIRIFPIHYKKLNFRTLFTLRAIASIDADATFKLVFVTIPVIVIVGGGDCEDDVDDADARDEKTSSSKQLCGFSMHICFSFHECCLFLLNCTIELQLI